MLRLLVLSGVDVEATDVYGRTASFAAVAAGQAKSLEVLIDEAGAGVDSADSDGHTLFWAACALDLRDIVLFLAERDADVLQGGECAHAVVRHPLDPAGVDHESDVIDGDARLARVRGRVRGTGRGRLTYP